MSDARTMAWANLMSAAHAFSTADSKETRAALSREAMAWAAVNGPQRVATGERSAVAGDGFTFRFGKSKGKTPGEVDVRDLRWYEKCALEALDNPEKERWRDSNQRDLDVIRAELRQRGEAADHG